jgi:hypothetical protein
MLQILYLLSFLFISAFILGFLRQDAKDLILALQKFFKDLSPSAENTPGEAVNPKV